MLALLQTISDHLRHCGFFYVTSTMRRMATEDDLNHPVSVVGVTLKGETVISETLRDVLSATDLGLMAERTFLLCAIHKLPEDAVSRLVAGFSPKRNVTEYEYREYVSDAVAKMAHERHIMTMEDFLAFPHKQQLGKHLVNKLLISGLLLQDHVRLLVEEAVLDPDKYWVPAVGRVLLADVVDGVNSEFRCHVQVEEAADGSGWPPIGWPVK